MPTTKARGRAPIYPWDDWMDSTEPVTIWYGKDYKCKQNSMNTTLRKRAADYGMGISIDNLDGTGIKFIMWDLKKDEPKHFIEGMRHLSPAHNGS